MGMGCRLIKYWLALLFAIFAFAYSLRAHGQTDDANPTLEESVDSVGKTPLEELISDLKNILEETKTPGAGIAIVNNDQDIWVGGLGFADTESKRKADADTFWRIGSISKMFVALAALKLQEEGLIKLEDPIGDYVTDVPIKNRWETTDPITVAHLLEHTSGFDDLHFNEYALNDPDITLEEAFLFNPRSRKSRWRPGTYTSYSNANPPLVAYAIEKIVGTPFEVYVAENLFKPIGMAHADYFLSTIAEERLAKGYQGKGRYRKAVDYWHIIMRPSGSINTSANEMARLVKFFLNRGELEGRRILSKASIDRMETVETALASQTGLEFGYALNNYSKNMHGYSWRGHNGGMSGYLADLTYLPEHGVGYAIMVNKTSPAIWQMGVRINRFLKDQLPEPNTYNVVDLTHDHLKKYAGTYQAATTRNQFQFSFARLGITTVAVENGELIVERLSEDPILLKPASENTFYRNRQRIATTAFYENQEGQMCLQGVGNPMIRVSPWKAWTQLILAIFCGVMIAVSLLFIFVAMCGRMIGYFKEMKHWKIRLMPSYATLAFIGSFLVIAPFTSTPMGLFTMLGNPTWVSVVNFLLSLAYPVLAIWACYGLYTVFRYKTPMHWAIKSYLTLACIAGILINAYGIYWNGLLPSWIY